jgi:hypothetical protein
MAVFTVPILIIICLFLRSIFTNVFTWIMLILPFALTRILALLGFGLVGYTGFDLAIDGIETYVFSAYDSIGTDLVQMLNMMGFLTGLKILFGAMSGVITLKIASAATKIAFGRSGA